MRLFIVLLVSVLLSCPYVETSGDTCSIIEIFIVLRFCAQESIKMKSKRLKTTPFTSCTMWTPSKDSTCGGMSTFGWQFSSNTCGGTHCLRTLNWFYRLIHDCTTGRPTIYSNIDSSGIDFSTWTVSGCTRKSWTSGNSSNKSSPKRDPASSSLTMSTNWSSSRTCSRMESSLTNSNTTNARNPRNIRNGTSHTAT